MNRALVAVIALILAPCAYVEPVAAQVPTLPNTYLAAPVTNQSTGNPSFQTGIFLLDPSLVGSPNITVEQATGLPFGTNGYQFVIDIESMAVQSQSNGVSYVRRGANGTRTFAHGALANVWVASARYFWPRNPSGVCNPFAQLVQPAVAIPSGNAFQCFGDGTWGGADSEVAEPAEPNTGFPGNVLPGYGVVAIVDSGGSYFPWSAAQFAWNATVQGAWEPIFTEQGDWNIAALPWQSSTWAWKDIAGYDPQILNVLP